MNAKIQKTLRKTLIGSLAFAVLALTGACGDANLSDKVTNDMMLSFEMMPPSETTSGMQLSFFSLSIPAQVQTASVDSMQVSVRVVSGNARLTGTLSKAPINGKVIFDDLMIEGGGPVVIRVFMDGNDQIGASMDMMINETQTWGESELPRGFSESDIVDESNDMRHALLAQVVDGGQVRLFLHDRLMLTTSLVSITADSRPTGIELGRAGMSGDGRYVAFNSCDSTLVANDDNQHCDVFVYDRETGKNHLISRSDAGGSAGGNSEFVGMSSNGRYITFESDATDVVSPLKAVSADIQATRTFRMDLATSTVELVDSPTR